MPAAQLAEILEPLQRQYGPFLSVTGEGQRFTIVLERVGIPTRLVLE